MKVSKPNPDEYAAYYERYISKVDTDNPIKGLAESRKKMVKLISGLSKKQLNYRYAEDKWTIREILVHVMDGERVFGYRALRFARNDQTPLPGYEENEWAPESKAAKRKIKSIMREYRAVREATIEQFSNFDEEMMMRSGTANNNGMSVRALLYVILGHEIHHMGVIKEKYLQKN